MGDFFAAVDARKILLKEKKLEKIAHSPLLGNGRTPDKGIILRRKEGEVLPQERQVFQN